MGGGLKRIYQEFGITGKAEVVNEYGPSMGTSNDPAPIPNGVHSSQSEANRNINNSHRGSGGGKKQNNGFSKLQKARMKIGYKTRNILDKYGISGQPQQVDEYGPAMTMPSTSAANGNITNGSSIKNNSSNEERNDIPNGRELTQR